MELYLNIDIETPFKIHSTSNNNLLFHLIIFFFLQIWNEIDSRLLRSVRKLKTRIIPTYQIFFMLLIFSRFACLFVEDFEPLFLALIEDLRVFCLYFYNFLFTFYERFPLCKKCPNTDFILVCIFQYLTWIRIFKTQISVFGPNTGKYGPEKTLYLDTSHVVYRWAPRILLAPWVLFKFRLL